MFYHLTFSGAPKLVGMLVICRYGCWSGFAIPTDTGITFEMKGDFNPSITSGGILILNQSGKPDFL